MKKNVLWAVWAGLFCICAALGFLPNPEGFLGGLMTLLAVLFFLPPALLLWRSRSESEHIAVRLIRNLALVSLGLTLVGLLANVASVLGSELLGNVLHGVLGIVSVPMFCGRIWAISLFGWACLLMASLILLRNGRKASRCSQDSRKTGK